MNPNYRPWTREEEQRVRDGYAADEPWGSIAVAIGRSEDAVKTRASRLGLRCVDMDGATDPGDRWAVGKPAGGTYWTRERILDALRAYIRRTDGLLPAGMDAWYEVKKGDPSLPTGAAVAQRVFSEDCPTFGHLWLRLGAPRKRVKTLGGAWTEAEHEYLMAHAGSQRLVDIAKHLHRTYAACKRRLYDYGTTARNAQGFMSMRQVAEEYGCDVHRVRRFVRMGILTARLRHGNRYEIDPADAMAIADALRAPAARGKGWRYEDGRPVPPKPRRRAEPEVITRVKPRGWAA